MKSNIETIADGLKYMQSKLSGTFIIQYVKYDKKWQFAPSTSAKSQKIKCKTFEQMLKKGHDYMAKKFQKKYGYSYKEDFDKETRIKELEDQVKLYHQQVKDLTNIITNKERNIEEQNEGFNSLFERPLKKLKKNSRRAEVHQEMFRSFKGIIIHSEDDDLPFTVKLEIKSIKDIDQWADLDPKDYQTQYTNAYQRLAYRKKKKK